MTSAPVFAWVLGPPRSGTSAVTRALGTLGGDVGAAAGQLAPDANNPRGYFEHEAVNTLNDELLAHLGGSFLTPPPLPAGWHRAPALEPLRERARALLAERYTGPPPHVVKDPRLSLTLPFWADAVAGPSVCVVCLRHPAAVLDSFARTGAVPRPTPARFWLVYAHAALTHAAAHPHAVVLYERLLGDPAGVLAGLAALLGRSPARERLAAAAAAVEAGLRHQPAGAPDLEALLVAVLELALGRAGAAPDGDRAAALAEELGGALARERELRAWLESREEALRWHEERVAEQDAALAWWERHEAETQRWLREREEALAWHAEQLARREGGGA